jgi:hypothetical protein
MVAATAWLGLWAPAHAALGGDAASIEADRARLTATMTSTVYAGYAAYVLTLPNHGVVQEFLNAQGQVFAISWRAPGRPDLRQLLGARFDALQSDNAPRTGHKRRRRSPLAVDRTDFVLRSGGRPGAFRGFAYLSVLVPAGFSISDIQ